MLGAAADGWLGRPPAATGPPPADGGSFRLEPVGSFVSLPTNRRAADADIAEPYRTSEHTYQAGRRQLDATAPWPMCATPATRPRAARSPGSRF